MSTARPDDPARTRCPLGDCVYGLRGLCYRLQRMRSVRSGSLRPSHRRAPTHVAVRRGNERRDVESSTARAPARRIDAPEVPATGTRHHGSGQAASGRPWSFNRQASCGSSWHKPHTPAASVDVVADVLDSREGVAVVGTEQDVPSRGPSRTRRSQQQPGLPAGPSRRSFIHPAAAGNGCRFYSWTASSFEVGV